MKRCSTSWRLEIGVFLLVGAAYGLSGPGRIDIIDGQWRYEVAANLVSVGLPIVRDPALGTALPGLYGFRYSSYNAGASVTALPFVWLGDLAPDPDGEMRRFLFSFTSGIFGAMTAAILFRFYQELGVSPGMALRWTAVSAFATLLWPVAASTFDQVQHAFLVLLAVLLGHLGAKRSSALTIASGGLAAGLLLNFQESYALLVPALALSTLGVPRGTVERRRPWAGYLLFLAAAGIGLALWLKYNSIRFGNPFFFTGKLFPKGHPAAGLFGNPLAGLLSLLISPGKSIFLYSPPLLLGLLGIASLRRREPALALTIVAVSLVQLGFVSSLRFFGSDWAWGPRYLVVTLPLWALAFPFVERATIRRTVAGTVVALGLVVQLLALSIDHQRFFFERALPAFFWARDPWSYFKHSALLARPGEIAVTLRDGVPKTARWFAPGPYPHLVTYAIFGNAQSVPAPLWMRHFQVFYVPRPWLLWMLALPPDRRPVNPLPVAVGTLGLGLLGAALVRSGLRAVERADVSRPCWAVKE
jgi:hypothetical protein